LSVTLIEPPEKQYGPAKAVGVGATDATDKEENVMELDEFWK
jgi:hypothetical protein